MKDNASYKNWYSIIALVISGAICAGLIFILYDKYLNTLGFEENLKKLTAIYIGISGFLSAILMVFLAATAMRRKSYKAKIIHKISKTTQKMHHFRTIAEILFNSNIWLPGLKEYMEKDYAGLTYFELKEFYKGKSKLAIEFLQQSHHFGDTENVYLELKSLLMTHPLEKRIPETIDYPIYYNNGIIEKWAANKCGAGLWYIFGYKYGQYKQSINLEAVFERHKEKILTLANTINHDMFENSSFNEVFFSKLWEHLTKDVIPKLLQFQEHINKKTPQLVNYLYIVFLLLMVFGVLLPLTYLMIGFSAVAILVGFSIVVSTLFYVAITFHVYLSKEVSH